MQKLLDVYVHGEQRGNLLYAALAKVINGDCLFFFVDASDG